MRRRRAQATEKKKKYVNGNKKNLLGDVKL
jgi:hypothetical protein